MPDTRQRVDFYLRSTPGAMPEALTRAALGSVAQLAIIPVQDLLGLGSAARINTPGNDSGNWSWRLPPGALTPRSSHAITRSSTRPSAARERRGAPC